MKGHKNLRQKMVSCVPFCLRSLRRFKNRKFLKNSRMEKASTYSFNHFLWTFPPFRYLSSAIRTREYMRNKDDDLRHICCLIEKLFACVMDRLLSNSVLSVCVILI